MNRAVPFGSRATADQVLAGVDLTGKHIMVTGCNSGLGFETMNALAANGAQVIGLARSAQAAAEACARAGKACIPVPCDLADLDSVAQAARIVGGLNLPLDAIIANAAVAFLPTLQTRYGVELQFLVNYLGHFSLLHELAGLVREGTGRIVIVSSDAGIKHAPPRGIEFDNLDGGRGYHAAAFYAQSKLALAVYAKELSRRWSARGIVVNSLHPGGTRDTRLHRYLGVPKRLLMATTRVFRKTTQQGAATQSFLAASPRAAGVSGEYWSNCEVVRGSPHLDDPGLAQTLWTVSERIVRAHRARQTGPVQVAA